MNELRKKPKETILNEAHNQLDDPLLAKQFADDGIDDMLEKKQSGYKAAVEACDLRDHCMGRRLPVMCKNCDLR